MIEIQYMPAHENCSLDPETGEGICSCKRRGFTSYRMAAIFAYHHCLCNLCMKHINNKEKKSSCEFCMDKVFGSDTHRIEDMSPGEKMECLWNESTCSAEWWINEY